ncbi:MAG: hypothetical protein ACKOZM_01460 [Flavobacteriales bacterium]
MSRPIDVITVSTNHVVAITHASDNSTSYIQVYRKDNGTPLMNLTAGWEITGAVSLGSDGQLFILGGNSGGEGYFAYLNLNTSSLNENFSFYENSPISGLFKGIGNDFYAIQSSGLVHYVNNFSNYTVNGNSHPSKVVFDDLNQNIWTVEPDGVHLFNSTLTSELLQIPLSDALDVWLFYNK